MFYSIFLTLDAASHRKNYTLMASTKKLLESERAGRLQRCKDLLSFKEMHMFFSFYWSCQCQFWIKLTQPFTKCYDYFFHSNPFFDNVLIQIIYHVFKQVHPWTLNSIRRWRDCCKSCLGNLSRWRQSPTQEKTSLMHLFRMQRCKIPTRQWVDCRGTWDKVHLKT